MEFDINRPWLSLDPWQKDYVYDKEVTDNFLLTGRQVGKTTAMSLRAVELCMHHYKKGEFVLINSITEKQAYHMLAKSLVYAEEIYGKKIDYSTENKPTKHRIMFKNGTGILCYAAGETGEGLRGFTIKKRMCDEGARMSEEYFIATSPMLSVVGGTTDIASTPAGKKHKDGSLKFFYKCSKDDIFKKYYISAEDCPRHTEEFLIKEKERLSKLAYAQEYLAVFTDELRRLFSDEWIALVCKAKRGDYVNKENNLYMGNDIAGLGGDETTYEMFEKKNDDLIVQFESMAEKFTLTTEISKKIINFNKTYDFKTIGIDDGGVGFGVWCELMAEDDTKRKTIALNNASRRTEFETFDDKGKSKKILKEEMYILLQTLGEKGKIILLDDDEVKASLATIQHDEGKIFGFNAHHAEGIVRGVWIAEKDEDLNIYIA